MNTNIKPSISEAVANLRAACIANTNWEISFFDVKHLNEQEHEYRLKVKELIKAYRAWERITAKQRDVRVLAFAEMEGRILKNTLIENLTVYRTIRAERKFLTEVYIGQLRKP